MTFLRWLKTPEPSEYIIEANHSCLLSNIRELWRFRDLLVLFVRREFVTKYRQTALGPLWHILQPLILTCAFTLTFGKIVKISTDGLPAPLFYMSGLLVWGYFVQSFDQTAGSLAANAGLFNKVYFPRLVIPLAAVTSKLMAFGVQFLSFLVLYIYYAIIAGPSYAGIHSTILLLPIFLLITAALSLGAGLWIAALTVKYRDFGHITPYLLQLLLYGTPIIYPASTIPAKYHPFLALHPLAIVVEGFRKSFFGVGIFNMQLLLSAILISFFVLVTGTIYFNRVERNFVDTV